MKLYIKFKNVLELQKMVGTDYGPPIALCQV